MKQQGRFNKKGIVVKARCLDCGMILGNYSDWYGSEGPLCYMCFNNRKAKDIRDKIIKENRKALELLNTGSKKIRVPLNHEEC